MKDDPRYKAAVKRVKKKKGFYRHLVVFIAVNAAIGITAFLDDGTFEGFIPAIFWGIGLTIHYFNVFGIPGLRGLGSDDWEKREIEKELEKMNYFPEDDKLELNESPDDESLELKEMKKARRNYDDGDFV